MAAMSSSREAASQPDASKDGPTPSEGSKAEKQRWLVLIGVGFYMEGTRRLTNYPNSLRGPIHDIELVREFFTRHLGVDEEHILTLKATDRRDAPAGTDPEELAKIPLNEPTERDKAEWPTYENILGVLHTATQKANPGDLVYIYYSGHGAQASTLYPRKGGRGVDEGLAPLDINCGGRYVRDFEIAAILHKRKDLHVTVLFDCCHSGGATKGPAPENAVPRGTGTLDVTKLPSDISDISEEDLDSAFQAGALHPSSFTENFWLNPQGYVLMAACLPFQSAWEWTFSGVRHGVFTFWLIDSLQHAIDDAMLDKLTHDMLHRRVFANVIDWGKKAYYRPKDQVPVLMGNSKRLFTGSTISKSVHSIPLLDVLTNEVRLGEGQVHGVCEKDYFGIYRWNDEIIEPGQPIAIVRVQEVFEYESMAAFYGKPTELVNLGDQAILLSRHIDMGTDITLLYPDRIPEILRASLNLLPPMLTNTKLGYSSGTNPLRLVNSPVFHVTIKATGEYELLDRKCRLIPNLPAFRTGESVLDAAQQLGRYVRFRDLKNPDQNDRKFSFELVPEGAHGRSEDVYVIPEGGRYQIRFKSESFEPLYLTILDFRPLWGIRHVYPTNGDWDEITYPNYDRTIPFAPAIPSELRGSVSHTIGTLKAFITTRPISFRSLCMADVDLEGPNEGLPFWLPAVGGGPDMQAIGNDPERQLLETLSSRDPFPPQVVQKGAKGLGPASRNQNVMTSSGDIAWQTSEVTICTLSNGDHPAIDMQLPADAVII